MISSCGRLDFLREAFRRRAGPDSGERFALSVPIMRRDEERGWRETGERRGRFWRVLEQIQDIAAEFSGDGSPHCWRRSRGFIAMEPGQGGAIKAL